MPRGMLGKARYKEANPLTADVVYSDEEVAFLKAVDRWRREHGGRIPTCCEVLKIALALGYTKHPGGGEQGRGSSR